MMFTGPQDNFDYVPEQSFCITYGIDQCENPKVDIKKFGDHDARKMSECLVNGGVVVRNNMHLFSTSLNPDACKADNISDSFSGIASKVGREGLFIFYYSGPGVEVGSYNWSLTPYDFNLSNAASHITSSTLTNWLITAGCKAKYVLFILDCPFANKIASSLTVPLSRNAPDLNICTLSTHSALEPTPAFAILSNSVFSYFLCKAVQCSYVMPGLLPIRKIYSAAESCSVALSSLVVTYDPVEKCLSSTEMQPSITARNFLPVGKHLDPYGDDYPDGVPGNFAFLTKHFNKKTKAVNLHEKAYAWLQAAEDMEEGPLVVLAKNGALEGDVLQAVICSMMCSLASFQVALEEKGMAANPNLLIIAFLQVAATVASASPGLELGEQHFKYSWEFYHKVLHECGVNTEKVRGVFVKVCEETNGHPQ